MKSNSLRIQICGLLLAVAGLLVPLSVSAQVGSDGAILGVVTDPSGALVAGAQVTVTNLNTGLKKTAITSSGGNFEIQALPIGSYSVSVGFTGFKTWTIERTELTVGQRKRVSPVLEVGEISETVSVESQAELVQTEKGSIETIVEEKVIRELPLNGRNPILLVGLVPGMRVTGIKTGLWNSNSVQGLGQRTDQAEFQMDGVSSLEHADKSGIGFPSVETIAEFNVETSNFTAEHGGQPLQVLMATKSGSNAFHGSLWEFIRNDKLDARNTFATSKPKLRRNQFGATGGGPVIKDKTFFFGSFEGTRIRQERVYNSFTVAPAMLTGDFSSLLPGKRIIDPTTGQPFPNNIIPDDRISSASKFFFPYILQPNSSGQRFRAVASAPDDLDVYSGRVDHHLTNNQKLFFRLVVNDNTLVTPNYRPDIAETRTVLQHNLALNYDWTLSPTTLLTLGGGYLRSMSRFNSPVVGQENLTNSAGIQGFQTEGRAAAIGLPSVSFAGYQGFAAPWGNPGRLALWSENYKANLSLIRGPHSLSFGYQYQDGQSSTSHASCCSRGVFGFNGQYTGDGFADYLLGLIQSSSRNFPLNTIGVADSPYSGLYVQDFWKVNSSLTFNLGLRYDYWHEKAFVRGTGSTFLPELGKSVAGENAKTGRVDLTSQAVSPFLAKATEGLWISASEAGLPPGLFVARGTLSPRLGVAWRPFGNNDWVVRGGYGLFPSIYRDNITGSSIIGPPYWTFETQGWGRSQLQRWEQAWPQDPNSFIAPSVTAARPDFPNMKSHQWNVSIQKSVPALKSALTLSYVGNRGIDLLTEYEFNTASVGPHTNLQADRPWPAFGDVSLYDAIGESWYQSLQVKWERRFTEGLSYQLSYSFSKNIDIGGGSIWDIPTPFAPEGYNRGRSVLDHTHILTVNEVWELPFGKGRQYLSNMHPVANGILGGWQFSTIYSFISGDALTFGVPGATLGNGFGTRPHLNGNLDVSNPSAERWFNVDALVAPPLYTFGGAGKGIFDGPGIHAFDTNLSKNFYFGEARYLQFRWEMFNAPNHVNLSNPNTNIGQGTTGRILSARDARQMQFGLKFIF
ncbi:MAG: TonB-dependent receptor [Acidobacteriota bacterium]